MRIDLRVQGAERVGLNRELRDLETDANVALRREVVDLVRSGFPHQPIDRTRIKQIPVVLVDIAANRLDAVLLMLGNRVAANQSIHFVTEPHQIFSQVRTVLP